MFIFFVINGGRWGLRRGLEIGQLRAVIDASLSLIKAGQVESAESLLNSFSSELAEVRSTVGQDLAKTWQSSGQTNGRSAV